MSNSYVCSINKNSGYYLKENKLEKYHTVLTPCAVLLDSVSVVVFINKFTLE